nr:hypothetical protein CFP56_74891 [Quercus suber]
MEINHSVQIGKVERTCHPGAHEEVGQRLLTSSSHSSWGETTFQSGSPWESSCGDVSIQSAGGGFANRSQTVPQACMHLSQPCAGAALILRSWCVGTFHWAAYPQLAPGARTSEYCCRVSVGRTYRPYRLESAVPLQIRPRPRLTSEGVKWRAGTAGLSALGQQAEPSIRHTSWACFFLVRCRSTIDRFDTLFL